MIVRSFSASSTDLQNNTCRIVGVQNPSHLYTSHSTILALSSIRAKVRYIELYVRMYVFIYH